MYSLVFLIVASVMLSWLVVNGVARLAERWRLVQSPNHRSSHAQPTPNGGGLGIVVASGVAGTWLALGGLNEFWIVLILSLPLAVIGLIDDIRHLPARIRFVVQIVVVAGLLALLGRLPPLMLFPGMSLDGLLLSAMLLLIGVWWINLFNFMDGIDGLAGAQAIFMLVMSAGLAAWMQPEVVSSPVWLLAACMAAATLGFLILNWPPARIFMGDVGSTWLAFMILAFALLSIQAGWLSYTPWIILAAVFVADATVTLITRMLRRERWYEAHRSHAYQRLSRRWYGERNAGHRAVTLLVLIIDLLWLAPLAWASFVWPQWSVAWLALAYGPLVFGVILLGAGKPDPV